MRTFTGLFLFLVSLSAVSAQNRAQAIADYETLRQKAVSLEKIILAPSKEDTETALRENLNVFRILPRGNYPEEFFNRGGGAYYSFVKQSHSYNETPQLELQQNNLSVGFYGLSYGLIADLGEIQLSETNEETAGVSFLIKYQPATDESKFRNEYYKIGNGLQAQDITFKHSILVNVGHTYVLRAVSFDEADTLVTFAIYRKDTDGSLIIFWKKIKDFETPKLERSKTAPNADETKIETIDSETAIKVQNALVEKGLFSVSVEATNTEVILRGTVPKGKMAEAVMRAQETGKRKVRNELTEQ